MVQHVVFQRIIKDQERPSLIAGRSRKEHDGCLDMPLSALLDFWKADNVPQVILQLYDMQRQFCFQGIYIH
jgi:hypothetical protein